ncbi:hypothetical protein GGR54DRAFT_382576 [Hypoxylon sp. NC1633]|nr:hypothetical protein GGR54DRAFT_382576 [Hypoxylon sp. NC1633]
MASDPAGPATSQAGADDNTFSLQIISPSIGIPQPLALQDVPIDTTVKQLKERIRDAVSLKPSDQAQRLIHRGRLLARDNETMTEVFGQEALRSTELNALHLVLRDLSDGRPAPTPNPLDTTHPTTASIQHTAGAHHPHPHPPTPQQHPSPAPHPHPQPHHHQHHTTHFQAQPQVRIGMPQFQPQFQGLPFGMVPQGTIPGAPLPGQTMTAPLGLTPQQYHQYMRAMNANNQRIIALGAQVAAQQGAPPGAPPGAPGAQDIPHATMRGAPGVNAPGMNTPGRTASPLQSESSRTTVRESTGAHGLQWRITFNETFVNNPLQRPGRTASPLSTADSANALGSQPRSVPNGGQLSNQDVQNMMRAADAGSATRTLTDAMRNASNSSLTNLTANQAQHPIAPGVTTPLIPSRGGSATGTPDPLRADRHTRSPATIQHQTQSSQRTPDVYILSSPTGPRALLLNGNLDTYFTPPIRTPPIRTALQPYGLPIPRHFQPYSPHPPNRQHIAPTPTIHLQTPPGGQGSIPSSQASNTPQPQPAQAQHQQGLRQPPQAQPHIGHAVARADNPQVQAIRLAHLMPHLWMAFRLGLFIWFFTSPTSSWSRWVAVISVAITLFLVNIGLLNPVAEQFWVPLRRHLENLIPHAQPPAGTGNAHGGSGNAPANAGQQDGQLNPADTAARLVQQRRNANTNWLVDQVRRLERAGILFLASIAPGVAERHIAQMEAEVRAAERRRREAEAEAAAAAAEAEAEAAAAAEQTEKPADAEQTPAAENGDGAAAGGEQAPPIDRDGDQGAGDQEVNARPPVAEEPLIAA